jgi:AraC-like DNA-binding protein
MKEQHTQIYVYKRVVQAKLYIDAHYSEGLDLDNISDEACFSKFHFIRLFKSMYGRTPHQYLTWVRIEQAKLLLQKGNAVSETCFRVGFDSVSSFTGLFKKLAGATPSAYQKQYLLMQQQIAKAPLQFIPNCFAQQNGWTKKSNFEEVV